jgi:type VI secretion system protein ImpE
MSAEEQLKRGDIEAALALLEEEVRGHPQVARHRIFLFQLLCVLGDWERAVRQLKIAAELDPEAIAMAQTYREAIVCEVYREKVFLGEKEPLVFGEPQAWLARLVQALKLTVQGETAQAAELRGQAFDSALTQAGQLNGDNFNWIADADMRLGPVLEIVVNGKYFWMPFGAIGQLTADEPEDLRDHVWMPVNVTLNNGGEIVGLVPTRYPGVAESEDPSLNLARRTEWSDIGDDTFVGRGQRILATNTADVAVMDVRDLTIGGAEYG